MAIVFDKAGSVSVASGTVVTLTHTVAGPNPIIIVGVNSARTSGTFIGTPQYSGVNMIRVGSAQGVTNTTELYFLNAPPTGLGTFIGTSAGAAAELTGFSMSFKNVDQTSANAIVGSSSSFSSGVTTVTLQKTLAPSSWYVGFSGIRIPPGTTATANGQVEAGQVTGGTSTLMASYEAPTAVGLGTLTWNFPSGTQASVAAEVRAGGGSIALDATGAGSNAGIASTLSWTHTITGANPAVVVLFRNDSGKDVTNISFQGNNLTKIIAGTRSEAAELWYLKNPPTGLGTFNGTLSASSIGLDAVSASFTGVDQTTSIGGSSLALGTNASSGSVSLASTVDTSWLVGGVGLGGVALGTEDLTTGQLSQLVQNDSTSETRFTTNGPLSPIATGKMRWTTAAAQYVMVMAELRPTPLASNAGPTFIGYKSQLGVGY